MDNKDEKFLNSIRLTQPVLLATALFCLVLAALIPKTVNWWMGETNVKSAFVASPEFRKTVDDFRGDSEAERQLKRIVVNDIDGQDKMYKLLKIFMSLMLIGPLVIIFVACLNDYRIYHRFLKILSGRAD